MSRSADRVPAGVASDPDPDPDPGSDPDPPRTFLVPALVIGWALIAFGAWSALRNSTDANPISLVLLVVGFDLLHDVVVAPLLFSAPLVTRLGQRPTNSSTLPLAYERNAAIILIGVWVLAGAFIALRVARARRA